MVNIFLSHSRFAGKNIPFKPCTNITMFFFNKKQIVIFILLNESKNVL